MNNKIHSFIAVMSMSTTKSEVWRLFLVIALVLISAIGLGLLPLFVQKLISDISDQKADFLVSLILVTVIIVLSQTATHVSNILAVMVVHRININLGVEFIKRSVHSCISEYILKGPAQIIQILQNARASTANTLQAILMNILPSVVQVVVAIVVLISLDDIFVTSMIVFYVFIYTVFSCKIVGRLSVLFKSTILQNMESSKVVNNIVSNIETIKVFAAIDFVLKRFRQDQSQIYNGWLNFYKKGLSLEFFRVTLFALVFFVSLYYSSLKFLSGEISVGHFVMVSAYLFQVCQPYDSLIKSIGGVVESLNGFQPMLKHLDACKESIKMTSNLLEGAGCLELKDVCFSYLERSNEAVLNDLSLVFVPGEVVAITGPSGSGKSTLVKILMRLYEPSKGIVMYNNCPIADLSDSDFYARFSFITQEVGLFNETLRFNLKIADQDATDEQLLEVIKLACLSVFFDDLPDGLDTQIGERGLALSGGERQRLSIARSFLRKHSVIIFDESTSSLDEFTEQQVIMNIRKFNASNIIIIIAHRQAALDLADRIVLLNEHDSARFYV